MDGRARTADRYSLAHALLIRQPSGVRDYMTDEWVRVLDGAYEGFPGVVRGTDGPHLVVEIDIFGEPTRVLLLPESVTPIDPDEGERGSGVREPRNPLHPEGGTTAEHVESDEQTP